jgi:flagellar basal-body rod modification protein FlgD
MATIASAIFNHSTAAAQAKTSTDAASSASPRADATSATSTDSATISANDFLTLLVTEMKNQDPTANTDPNEYINQLVNVNSLEQLISINQTLTADSNSTSSSSRSTQAASSAQNSADTSGAAAIGTTGNLQSSTSSLKSAGGNLSVPAAQPSSQTVAHALDGTSHTHSKASE